MVICKKLIIYLSQIYSWKTASFLDLAINKCCSSMDPCWGPPKYWFIHNCGVGDVMKKCKFCTFLKILTIMDVI